MQKINTIDISIEQEQEQNTVKPEDVDKITVWHKFLEGTFNCRPLPTEGLIVWVSTLGHCDNKTMLNVIKDWAKYNNAAPKPSDLLARYNEYKRSEPAKKETKIIDGEVVYNCPYCHDTGWFTTYYGDTEKHGSLAESYVCKCEHDPKFGNLGKALSAAEWHYDHELRGFIKHGWVGDYE
jgi:hypothetical protein